MKFGQRPRLEKSIISIKHNIIEGKNIEKGKKDNTWFNRI
jgi:hypothetical protein